MSNRTSSDFGLDRAARSPRGESRNRSAQMPCQRIFLLSPANASGPRAKAMLERSMRSELAARVYAEGAPLGEIFSFISALYFRGKLAYARAFVVPPRGLPGIFVITASGGLVSPDAILDVDNLREISRSKIDPRDATYRVPLLRDAERICACLDSNCEVVLLGSIATQKYVEPLLSIFGERLLFPAEFVGRGDMSRGGLMLRCERAGVQLSYIPVISAVRHGSRPARLPKMNTVSPNILPASR